MTMRSKDAIVCECGHTGYVRLKENDQPYSSLWESYSLDGFSGEGLTITNYRDMPDDLLAHLKPKCPQCGEIGKVKYA